jgi:hypothetical protein
MSRANLIPVFIAKLREHADFPIIVDWYEDFLGAKEFPITLAVDSEHRDVLEICANLFYASQETTSDVVFGSSDSGKAMKIISSVALFTSIDLILAEFVAGDVKEKLSDLFNDALFRLSLPRVTESRVLDRALLAFFAKIFVPLNIARVLGGRDSDAVADENVILALLVQNLHGAGLCSTDEQQRVVACLGVDADAVERFDASCPDAVRELLRAATA